MECLGSAIDKRPLDELSLGNCSAAEMTSCSEDELEEYLNFRDELNAMVANWTGTLDTSVVTLVLTGKFDCDFTFYLQKFSQGTKNG